MEGLPSGDIQAKYQKLASEYSKLRVHVKVLKKGVLDEQAKCNELREALKEKDKSLRKGELEIDSLTFRNQQLTRRVSVLQDELDALQVKLAKKTKGKGEEKTPPASSKPTPLDSGLLQEELQKKIIENAHYASQLSDKVFEISQLRATVEDYQRHLTESDSRYKCEIAKLKNKNQELQYSLEEHKDKIGGTPNRVPIATSSLATSYNGDFLSEAGSLVGSEDALSSVDDMHMTDQLLKVHSLDQENQKLKMEQQLLIMEKDSLKLELSNYVAASQKRRGDGHDSGDFNSFGVTSVDSEGRVTGYLGSLQVPFVLSQETEARERRISKYFMNKISGLESERQEMKSKTEHYVKECEMLRLRFEELERDKEMDQHTLNEKHNTISRLEEELHSMSHNYEQQMSVLTEHVAQLTEQLAARASQPKRR